MWSKDCKSRTVVTVVLCFLVVSTAFSQTPDFQWTFDSNDSIAYSLTSVSSAQLYGGTLPADNPTINLSIGKRYQVTVVSFSIHPFEVLAKGASSGSDAVLLAMGATPGSFESDSGVAWTDDGAGHVQFTVTQALVNAMRAPGKVPGYRCLVHVDAMRGNFNIPTPPPPVDFSWTLTANGLVAWSLTGVSSPKVFFGALPADNPTINLIVGKRYQVTDLDFTIHPFQVIAKGASSVSDVVLLSLGSTVGSFESDPAVAWTDDGAGHVQFTVTSALVNAMRASGLIPGYRCGVHVSTMRGNFAIFGDGVQIVNPIGPRIAKGNVTIELRTIAEGLVSPLGMAVPNDGTGRMFVYDQVGQVWVISQGARLPTPFLDVSSRLVTLTAGYDERGLLGLACHPNFAVNHKVYTYTSEPVGPKADFSTSMPLGVPFDCQSVIAEWRVSAANANVIDPATRREILRIDKPESNHNAGQLHFGPDGLLYFGLGDGGAGDDQGAGHEPDGNAQDVNRIYGKLLRIDVDSSNSANGQYGIPADNPFVGKAGIDEIYAYGLRNPYAFSFDLVNGDLYVGDAGQNNIEEVDLITKGGNFGWRFKEGTFFFDPATSSPGDGFVTTVAVSPPPPGLIDPIAEYDHDDGHVVVGGYVYRGVKIAPLIGRYVCAEFGTSFTVPSGRLFYLNASSQLVEFTIGITDRSLGLWVKGFGQDLAGDVYVFGSQQLGPTGTTGQMLKIVPLPPAAVRGSWPLYN